MVEIGQDIKLAVWDLDGTLLDSFSIFASLVTDIAPTLGLEPPTREFMLQNFHKSLEESIADSFEGRLSAGQAKQLLDQFLSEQDQAYVELEEHLLEDALDLTGRLAVRGTKQVIVTNRDHAGRGNASPRSIVERSSLKDHFYHIICGDEVELRKPHKEVLGSLIEDQGIQSQEVVVIGDQHVDAQLALNLDSRGIIVARNGDFSHELLDTGKNWQDHISVVSSLKEVAV